MSRFVTRTMERFGYTYSGLMAEDEGLYTALLVEQRGGARDE